jgi:hypothetical protein
MQQVSKVILFFYEKENLPLERRECANPPSKKKIHTLLTSCICKKIFEFIKLRPNSGRFRIVMQRDGPTRIPLPLSPPMTKYESEVV